MALLLFISGLAMFLLAMSNLEQGIRKASGDRLRGWIANRTNTTLGSAASGMAVTALLQSSSMVSLLALAFVSAGVMPLFNGIGVVLGANLGTTLTGWLATLVGFKLELQSMIVPLLGLGAALNLNLIRSPHWRGTGQAIFAFGLLIFGLDIMKSSVQDLSALVDFASLAGMPAFVFFLLGVVLASLMQSSSAVMIIALSLLSTNLLDLHTTAAIAIGADLGTTSTTILGSLGGSAVKKQLAFAQVMFNLVTNILAFFILLPILPRALDLIGVSDPMFGLVLFHSSFNLMGLLLFLPILKHYARWVGKLWSGSDSPLDLLLDVPVEEPSIAQQTLKKSVQILALQALHLANDEYDLKIENASPASGGDFQQRYEDLKRLESKINAYAARIQTRRLDEKQSQSMAACLQASRDIVYASKTMKDILADYDHIQALGAPVAPLFSSHHTFLYSVFTTLHTILVRSHAEHTVQQTLRELHESNGQHFEEVNQIVSTLPHDVQAQPLRLSTWYNLNHEIHHSLRYWLAAVDSLANLKEH